MPRSKRTVKVKILDEVNCVLIGLTADHSEFFYDSFKRRPPNHFFNPKFKLGSWDGYIRYFHKTGKTHVYLLDEIIPKLAAFGYKIELVDQRSNQPFTPPEIDKDCFSHIIHSETGQPVEFRPYQVEGVNSLIVNGGGIVIAGTGAGKAQPLDCKIRTPSGWTTMGEISIGDKVSTPKGKTAEVVGVFPQGIKDIYRVTFHDGSTTKCCKEHLWQTFFPKQKYKAWTEKKVVDTSEIIAFLDRKAGGLHTPGNISIPLIEPIEMPKENLTVDPYVLGALIGDGALDNTIVFSSKDTELIRWVSEYVDTIGVKVVFAEGSNCDYRLSKKEMQNTFPPTPNPLVEKLKDLDLYGTKSHSKFIPTQYKQGTLEQRFELVRGLMDTDGTADKKGNISFTTVSEALAKDMQEVIWSLGGTCTITTRSPSYIYNDEKRIGRVAYTCFIRHPSPKRFFSLKRKQDRCRDIHADGRVELTRRVTKVEYIGKEKAQCIMVNDPDHLYITDDFIVTHNTLMNAALVDSYGKLGLKTITVVPSSDLILQTKIEFIDLGLDVGEYSGDEKDLDHLHVISTWQALQNNPAIIKQFQVVVVDEAHGLKGQVLTELLNKHGSNIAYRFGLTGTLPKADTDAMSVRIAVGDVQYTIPAHVLIEQGWLASLHIDIMQLEEDFEKAYDDFCKEFPLEKISYIKFKDSYFPEYAAEKRYLQSNKDRIEWIALYIEAKRDLKKGNVFCLVDGVAFGKKLTKAVDGAVFVHGKDKRKARKEIYDLFKNNDNIVVIATVQVASTGLNIKRIFNLMFIDVGKSFIRVIQTIGRGLRKAPDKDHVDVTDICTDLKYGKKHLRERIKFYAEAKYPHKKRKFKYND